MAKLTNGNKGEAESWLPLNERFSTLAIHAGYSSKSSAGYSAVTQPLSLSTTFEIDVPAVNRGFEYSRSGNPTRQLLEERLAALEGAKHGVCFSSGMAATSALLSLLKNGDHIICSEDIYGGTIKMMIESMTRNNFEVDFVDMTNLSNLKKALKANTKMIFLESPANPTLRVFDISEISRIAHELRKEILVAVDNTMLTSFFQRPLDFGADLVVYSLTKYANGHADVIMGAVITNDPEVKDKLCYFQNVYGAVPSPFDCFLVLRGLKTLHLRLPALMDNSTKVAKFLESHPRIAKVSHPALASHPDHQLAMRQSSGHSSVLSFTIKDEFCALKFQEHIKLIQNAASFGGCESLAEIPVHFTHKAVPLEVRERLGITKNFIRFAVGLESTQDLIDDLTQALGKC